MRSDEADSALGRIFERAQPDGSVRPRRVDKTVVLYGDVTPRCVSHGCTWSTLRPAEVESMVAEHVRQTGHTVMVPDIAAVRYAPG